jgi:hypothetical protein
MNLIKSIKNKIIAYSFEKKINNILVNSYSKEVTENFVHNNGRAVREAKNLVEFTHNFTDGLYLRGMKMFKDTSLISLIHKRDHVWFLLTGSITVITDGIAEHYIAPYIGFSKSGTQRAIYAHEESIFQNVFKNPLGLTDLDELEDFNYSYTKNDYTDFIRNNK